MLQTCLHRPLLASRRGAWPKPEKGPLEPSGRKLYQTSLQRLLLASRWAACGYLEKGPWRHMGEPVLQTDLQRVEPPRSWPKPGKGPLGPAGRTNVPNIPIEPHLDEKMFQTSRQSELLFGRRPAGRNSKKGPFEPEQARKTGSAKPSPSKKLFGKTTPFHTALFHSTTLDFTPCIYMHGYTLVYIYIHT